MEAKEKTACEFEALICEVQALSIEIEGMKADNKDCEHRGEAMTWPRASFMEASEQMFMFANRFRVLGG